MVRPRNHATGAQPFDTLAVADIGDVGVCLYDIKFVTHPNVGYSVPRPGKFLN